MRISISGAQNSGKTTLIKEFQKETVNDTSYLKGYQLFDEVVRSLINEYHIKINKEYDFISQLLILGKHIDNISKHENFITDRSILDAFVYATYAWQHGKMKYNEYELFKFMFEKHIGSYDLVFYLPNEIPLKEDGIRDTDKNYINEINMIYSDILKKYDIPFVEVRGDIITRLDLIKTNIECNIKYAKI